MEYNKFQSQITYIISQTAIFSIDELDDFTNNDFLILVVLTMIFGFYTLGCKVNQYETQAMEQLITAMGHTAGSFEGDCDCYVINTCSVTAVADKKNRAVIRRCRKQNPQAVLGVCGCYPQHAADCLKQLGVDVDNGFTPKYVNLTGRSKIITNIKAEAKSSKNVLLATDPDREGEAISWHIAQVLGVKAPDQVCLRILTGDGNAAKDHLHALPDILLADVILGKAHDDDHQGAHRKTHDNGDQGSQKLAGTFFFVDFQ